MQDELVTTKARLDWWIKACRKAEVFGFDTETSGLKIIDGTDTVVGFVLALDERRGCYIPVGHTTGEPQLDFDYVVDALKPLLEDPTLTKVAHNLAFDANVCAMLGIDIQNYDDTMLMSYALDGQKHRARGHNFDALTKFHFDYDSIRFQDVVLEELGIKNFGMVRLDHATKYASEDGRMTMALFDKLEHELTSEDLFEVYDVIDKPLARITADMKRRGVGLDMPRVRELHERWIAEADDLQDRINTLAGREINIGSPKQLGEYLFGELKLPVIEETDSGSPSTDDDTLKALASGFPEHRVLPLLRDWKELTKLTSGFTGSWLDKTSKTGRIHGDFKTATTNTRRLASSDPNQQNIPANGDNGKLLREVFIAKPVAWAPKRKRVLIGGDLSQAEYRMLAHEANCKPMLQMFAKGHDFHAATAADIFGGKWEQYADKKDVKRSALRSRMKNVNFANIYGAGAPKVAAMCGIPEKEGYRILAEYAERYPEIEAWKGDVKRFAHAHGYAETLFGGRVHVPHIKWTRQYGVVKYAERQAVNGVIQGGCADYVRVAMAKCVDACSEYEDAWLLLQVHDELIFEVYEDDAAELAPILQKIITTCTNDMIKWRVRFESDVKVGRSWAEIKG